MEKPLNSLAKNAVQISFMDLKSIKKLKFREMSDHDDHDDHHGHDDEHEGHDDHDDHGKDDHHGQDDSPLAVSDRQARWLKEEPARLVPRRLHGSSENTWRLHIHRTERVSVIRTIQGEYSQLW